MKVDGFIFLIICFQVFFFSCQKTNSVEEAKERLKKEGVILLPLNYYDSLYPLDSETKKYFITAEKHYANHQSKQAIIAANKALSLQRNPLTLNMTGLCYLDNHDVDTAIFYLRESIELDSLYLPAYINLANSYRKANNLKNSLFVATKGIHKATRTKDLWGLYFNRAMTNEQRKDFKAAKQDLDSAYKYVQDTSYLSVLDEWKDIISSNKELENILIVK